jgi:hypothetical protein
LKIGAQIEHMAKAYTEKYEEAMYLKVRELFGAKLI